MKYNKHGGRSFYQIGTLMSIIGDGRRLDIKQQHTRNAKRKKFLRQQIETRDGKSCYHCKLLKKLELDHVIPLYAGGTWNIDNLQLLCTECHVKKTQRIDRAFIELIQRTVEGTLHNIDKLFIDSDPLPPVPVPVVDSSSLGTV